MAEISEQTVTPRCQVSGTSRIDRWRNEVKGGGRRLGTGGSNCTFGFVAMRRHIKVSSSASKSMRKWSPGLARHGGGHGQPALRVECDNHGGIFPLSTDGVNLHRGAENVAKDGNKEWILAGRNIAEAPLASDLWKLTNGSTNWQITEVIQQRVELLDG